MIEVSRGNLKTTVLILPLFLTVGFFSDDSVAQQSLPQPSGFSGYIELLGAFPAACQKIPLRGAEVLASESIERGQKGAFTRRQSVI